MAWRIALAVFGVIAAFTLSSHDQSFAKSIGVHYVPHLWSVFGLTASLAFGRMTSLRSWVPGEARKVLLGSLVVVPLMFYGAARLFWEGPQSVDSLVFIQLTLDDLGIGVLYFATLAPLWSRLLQVRGPREF